MLFSDSDDFSIAVISFLTKCTGVWMHKNKGELYRRYLVILYTCYHLCFGITMQTIASIHNRDDIGEFIYTFFLTLATVLGLFKLILMYMHRQDFFILVKYLHEKFLRSEYDTREQELLNKCKRLSAIGIGCFTSFTYVTVLSFMVTPLIDNIGKNESDRLLPFAFAINLPLSMTPYYEITFVVQFLMLYQIAVCYTSFDYFLCLFNMHVATQFRILQYRLSHLNYYTNISEISDGKMEKPLPDASERCYASFKSNIQYHQSLISFCGKLEEVFSLIVLAEILSSSLVLTLIGIQLLGGASQNGGTLTFISYLVTSLIQLLMFTYTCDGLISESLNVAEAIFNAPWYMLLMNKYGEMLRKDVTLVMLKSRVPCCITAKGFFPISFYYGGFRTTFLPTTRGQYPAKSPPEVYCILMRSPIQARSTSSAV